MDIAYVTTYNASDVTQWSGLGHYISECLKDISTRVDYVGPLSQRIPSYLKIKHRFYSRVLKQGVEPNRHPSVAKNYSNQVASMLERVRADIVFSPGTIPIAHLKCKQPIVFWTDATFAGLVNFYPGMFNVAKESVQFGNELEQLALNNCRLALYSSDWAAKTALDNYSVDSSKIHVVPFGANLTSETSLEDVKALISARPANKLRLLFLGLDWRRKGGDIAVEVARQLIQMGIKAELHIVGPEIEELNQLPAFVIPHGRIGKTTAAGRKKLESLLADSHFLLLPTRAECYGVVFAEACSYGVPSVTTNVGGVGTAIKNGINGWAFDLESDPSEYASYIFDLMSDYSRYKELALSSYNEYLLRLNWGAAGKRVKALLQSVL
jgi:glycosyltransferase involved in cell wall biosynthesis